MLFFFRFSFLATLHLLNTDTIIITDDLYGMENKRFKTWYFNSLSFEHNRCVARFWPSYKKINYAIIGLPNKVQNVQVSDTTLLNSVPLSRLRFRQLQLSI